MGDLNKDQLAWLAGFLPGQIVPSGNGDAAAGPTLGDEPAQIASVVLKAPQPGDHGSWHDKSTLEFSSTYSLSWTGPNPAAAIARKSQPFDERIKLGFIVPGQGRLTLAVTVEGTQDNGLLHSDESFTQHLSASWLITADDAGKLTAVEDDLSVGNHDGDTNYRLEDPHVFTTPPLVGMRPRYVGTTETTSSESSKTVSVTGGKDGIGGGGSVGWGDGTSSTKFAPAVQTSMVVELNPVVPAKPPPPEPHVTVTVGPEIGAIVKLEFEIGPFARGKAGLEHGSLSDALRMQVWESLTDDEQTALIQGELAGQKWPDGAETLKGQKIEVHGYASTTDSKDHNLTLAVARAQAALDILKQFGIPDSTLARPVAHGEWDSVGAGSPGPTDDRKGEKEAAAWRKVVVKVNVARVYKVD